MALVTAVLTLAQMQTPKAAAETSRWVVHNVNWGYLSTIGDDKKPTAAVASFSDGAVNKSTGRIFLYLLGSHDPYSASLTVGEAAFNGTCGFAGTQLDPEDPRCAKITLAGSVAQCSGADEATGKAALFARHPQMKTWPKDHGFAVYELHITDIWMIDFYGGGAGVTPSLFLKVEPKNNRPSWPPSPTPAHPVEAPTTTSKAGDTSAFCDEVAANSGCCPACGYKWSGDKCVTTQRADTPYCKLLTEPKHGGCCVYCGHVWSAAEGKCVDKKSAAVEEAPPPWKDTAARARWLVSHSMWTAISTTSVRLKGAPWGNVRSIADAVSSTGEPYFYLPAPDPTQTDVSADAQITLSLTEAALPERAGVNGSKPCGGMDAEDPTCARIHLSGVAAALTSNATIKQAEAALKAKHPLAPWLAQGGAHTGGTYYTIKIDSIEFLDFYGGFANLSVAEYLAYKPSADSPARLAPVEAPTTTSKAGDTSAFCDEVAANSGCCPACGYKWSGDKCVTTQRADTPYCKLLTEPKHGGCCVYCGHVWSAAEGKCVDKKSAAVEEA